MPCIQKTIWYKDDLKSFASDLNLLRTLIGNLLTDIVMPPHIDDAMRDFYSNVSGYEINSNYDR